MVSADVDWQDRVHFFSVAARIMRRVLVDHARARGSAKRGAGQVRVSFDEGLLQGRKADDEILALEEALQDLERFDERKCRIVEMFFFAGMGYEEIGEALGLSRITVYRELTLAKAWLGKEMKAD